MSLAVAAAFSPLPAWCLLLKAAYHIAPLYLPMLAIKLNRLTLLNTFQKCLSHTPPNTASNGLTCNASGEMAHQ